MNITGKPRIVILFVSPDQRFIGNAVSILEMQFNGVDIIGVTASDSIEVTDYQGRSVPFIPLKELVGNGGGAVRHSPCCRCKAIWYVGSHKICTCN